MVVNSPQLLCHSIRLPGPAPHSPGALFLHQARNGYKHNPLALRLWSLLVTTAFPETLLFLLSPPNPPITSMVILPFTSEMIAVSLVDHILPVPISPKRHSTSFSSLFLEAVTQPWRKAPICVAHSLLRQAKVNWTMSVQILSPKNLSLEILLGFEWPCWAMST